MPLKYNETTGEFEWVDYLPEPEPPKVILKPNIRIMASEDEKFISSEFNDSLLKHHLLRVLNLSDNYESVSDKIIHYHKIGRARIFIIYNDIEDVYPIGMICSILKMTSNGKECDIIGAVDEEYRNKGVMTKCLPLFINEIKNLFVNVANLRVGRDNTPAIKLATNNGFKMTQITSSTEEYTYSLNLREIPNNISVLQSKMKIAIRANNTEHADSIGNKLLSIIPNYNTGLRDQVYGDLGKMFYLNGDANKAKECLNKIYSTAFKTSLSSILSSK